MSTRLVRLDENVKTLELIRAESVRDRRDDWALRYGLLECIQIVIDLACEVVAARNLGSPLSYGQCIELLEAADLMPGDMAGILRPMIGLRNLLVHEYDEIDRSRLTPLLNRLDDFRRFAVWYEGLSDHGSEGPC